MIAQRHNPSSGPILASAVFLDQWRIKGGQEESDQENSRATGAGRVPIASSCELVLQYGARAGRLESGRVRSRVPWRGRYFPTEAMAE